MPFNAEQLAYAGRAAIDFYVKNDPIDQINVAHPLLNKLVANKVPYGGALQNVVEQLRYQNDSNFQSYFGDQQVTYNRKRTVQQAKYAWGSFHDGFGLNEDELAQNGIIMTDGDAAPTDAETVQLTNLLEENTETLKLGFQENFDYMLHRDGSLSTTDIAGLDALISLTPASASLVGGLAGSTNAWWQNTVDTGITAAAGNLVSHMEIAWRACTRYGGSAPDTILVGGKFLDAYRVDAAATVNRHIVSPGLQKGGVGFDASFTGAYFKGIELVWDPVMDALQALDAPAINWDKRCYFVNSRFLKLRPIKGHWMVPRKPPRVYDRYTHYWGLTSKAALTTSKRNAHAVLSCA